MVCDKLIICRMLAEYGSRWINSFLAIISINSTALLCHHRASRGFKISITCDELLFICCMFGESGV